MNKTVQKVCTVVFAIALFALLTNFVSLMISTIENYMYVPSESVEFRDDFWKPLTVDLLIGTLAALMALSAGIASIFVKKPMQKLICFIFVACAVVMLLAGIIYASVLFQDYYFTGLVKHRYNVVGTGSQSFATCSAVISLLAAGVVYCAVIMAILLGSFLVLQKKNKVPAVAVQEGMNK